MDTSVGGSPSSVAKSAAKGGKCRKKTDHSSSLHPVMNPTFSEPKVKSELVNACQSEGTYQLDGVVDAFSDPFPCCVLSKFIHNEPFLEGLKNELLDQIFIEKNNDLYKFHQTDDVKKFSSPHVKALRKLFRTDVRHWLQEVTGIELLDKVDLTCSRYDYTDTLLCHDDELEGRRIAFILYLTPSWREGDGGALDLFTTDDNGQPKEIARSILPKWNNFAFFLVNPVSFHQVGEVLTEDKTRLSLNGWFHGAPIHRPEPYTQPPTKFYPHIHIEQEDVYSWINPVYLDPQVQTQIQEKFQQDSEIDLHAFLRDEKFAELTKVLASDAMVWDLIGPPNKRRYHRAQEEGLPDIVEECLRLFQSEAMFLTLSNLTGLCLHRLAPSHSDSEDGGEEKGPEEGEGEGERKTRKKAKLDMETGENVKGTEKAAKNPRCSREIRKWTRGTYTLLHDTDADITQFALDTRITFNCIGWSQDMGGHVSYVSKGEDEELLTVNPSENSLALVYRDKETLRFVKHVNDRVKDLVNKPSFTDISFVYYE